MNLTRWRPTGVYSRFFRLDLPSRKRFPAVLVVSSLLVAILVGRQIPKGFGGLGASILIFPLGLFLVAVWRLIPPPRAFNVLCICLALMPLRVMVPLGGLRIIPGVNGLYFWGQILFCLAFVFLAQVVMRRVPLPAMSGIGLAMLVFVLGGALALIGATGDSAMLWGTVCLLSVITLYVTVTVVNSLDQAERLLSAIVASMIVFGVVMYILLRSGVGVSLEPESNWELSSGRLGGGMVFMSPVGFGVGVGSNAPQVGEYVAMGLIISFAYALGARSNLGRLGALASVLLLSAVLLSAQARGAMIAVVAAVVVVIAANLVWPASLRGRLLLRLLALLVLVLPLAILVLQWRLEMDPTAGMLTSRMMALYDVSSDVNFVSRTELWRAAWAVVRRSPLGYGFAGTFLMGVINNPHFLYLWILQGSGWFGAFGFILALSGLAVVCLRGLNQANPRRRVLSTAALGILVLVLVEGLSSVVFATEQITTAFWAVMGISLAINGRRPGGAHVQSGDGSYEA